MSRKLWSAILCSTSPRFQEWQKILGGTEVPIMNPKPFNIQLGPDSTEAYKLDLQRFDRYQVQRLLEFIVERFGVKPHEAKLVLEKDGFPIRAEDVRVSYELRAFL